MSQLSVYIDPLFFHNFFLFIFGCAGSSLLQELFSSSGERGYSLVLGTGLLTAVASLVDHGL